MPPVARNVLAVIAGFVVGSVVNMAIVMLGPVVVAPPAGVDVSNAESIARSIHLFEPQHFLMPFLAHALGSLVGALVAYLLAATRHAPCGMLVGVLFLLGGIAAAFMMPAPAWFLALDLVLAYLPMAWLGTRVGAALRRPAAPLPQAA